MTDAREVNDAHAEIRKALEAGPTPGPWRIEPLKYDDGHAIWSGKPGGRDEYRVAGIGGAVPTRDQSEANAALIAACHPEAIRALLAERDALRADAEAMRMPSSYGGRTLHAWGDQKEGCTIRIHFTDAKQAEAWFGRLTDKLYAARGMGEAQR